jgi:hypothetical protein
VVDAADATFFVAAVEEIRAAVRAAWFDQTHAPLRIAKRHELLAEELHAQRRTVRRRQLARKRDREPVAPKVLAHRRARARASQKLVVGRRKHQASITAKRAG